MLVRTRECRLGAETGVNYVVNLIKQILNINHELTDWCRPLTIKQRNYHGDL